MKKNGVGGLVRKIGAVSLAVLCCGVIALSVALKANMDKQEEGTDVSGDVVKFGLPMSNSVVVKDYADDRLQYNKSLNRWEIHLAVDLASDKSDVFSVSDGVVSSVEMNALDGYVVKINHADGFSTIYSSLSDVNLKNGDKVSMGQKIGTASTSATNESADGSHLHLVMLRNGTEVDPNLYLDLQNK